MCGYFGAKVLVCGRIFWGLVFFCICFLVCFGVEVLGVVWVICDVVEIVLDYFLEGLVVDFVLYL